MSTRNTDELFLSGNLPIPGEQTIHFIDVHIYGLPEEEKELSSREDIGEQQLTVDKVDQEHIRPPKRRWHRQYMIPLSVGAVSILVISLLLIVSLLPVFISITVVTPIPATRRISTTKTIVVTPQAGAGTTLQGRILTAVSISLKQDVTTTGKGHQEARVARGYITFYNAATYAQTINAGTLLTSRDGMKIVTDQEVTLPAAQYPTFGQASSLAHAMITGPKGNIGSGNIYGPCCLFNISAVNGAFTGGQQEQDYQTVSPHDIATVTAMLKKSILQSEQAAVQTQVHSDETLITPLPCQQTITPDHQPGQKATHVSITVSEACTGVAYNTQAYQSLITQLINQEARQKLGDVYTLFGQIQGTITQVTYQKDNQLELQVHISGAYAYHFNQRQQ